MVDLDGLLKYTLDGAAHRSGHPLCRSPACVSYGYVQRLPLHAEYLTEEEFLLVFNYVSDGYTLYAASALSAMNVCRNSLGAAFPLFGTQVYDALGVHGAGSLVAGIATALSVVPFLALFYGSRLRSRSRFAKELARLEAASSAHA